MHKSALLIAYLFHGQGKLGLVIQTNSLHKKNFSYIHVLWLPIGVKGRVKIWNVMFPKLGYHGMLGSKNPQKPPPPTTTKIKTLQKWSSTEHTFEKGCYSYWHLCLWSFWFQSQAHSGKGRESTGCTELPTNVHTNNNNNLS